MQSPELLEQTASERLTLEQEYDMQNSWFQDENSKPDCWELRPIHCPFCECIISRKASKTLKQNIIVISKKEVKEKGTIN